MARLGLLAGITAAAISVFMLPSTVYWMSRSSIVSVEQLIGGLDAQRTLVEHSKEFDRPQIIKVTEGVWVAVGYAIANSILLEGPDGLVIVDVTESLDAAREIYEAFRRISNKTIKAIVYTHNHGDHVWGTRSFIDDVNNPPDIWGYHTLREISIEMMLIGKRWMRGAIHQLGAVLGKQCINAGLGPRPRDTSTPRGFTGQLPIFPNKLVQNKVESYEIAGLNLTFIHIPGETPDQMAVWLSDRRILLPGDNIYHTFPNLYAIRGTPPRDSRVWANSLRAMRALNADHLVPSHTRPVAGRQEIYDLLTVYASAIDFVHDQTIRRMNENLLPNEIGQLVRLPSTLSGHPFLQEFYGRVDWSSKGVYERYVGWFSGDPVELLPLLPDEKARRMVDLVGVEKLLTEAELALKIGDLQWALELASYVFRMEPANTAARAARLDILRALAVQQTNPLARNFYLTTAINDYGLINWNVDQSDIINKLEMADLLRLMKIRLKAELVDGVNQTIIVRFGDTRSAFRLQILYSVLTVEEVSVDTVVKAGELGITVKSEQLWRDIMMEKKSPAAAYTLGKLKVEGSLDGVRKFFSYF